MRTTLLALFLSTAVIADASIFGSVTGLIHDPQHRPVENAKVTLRSTTSDWVRSVTSDDSGQFHFDAVPLGQYRATVESSAFAPQEQDLVLTSGRDARLHFVLSLANVREAVEVTDVPPSVNPESSTTQTVISRQEIARTPGADQANSLAMITNFTPGAYMIHDQLHIRGGHQISWLLDGVPVPNTSIASNVGPQFDPKNIDFLEAQRGGYSAEYGDRTFGVFNVVTRSGFERNRQGELVASYGSYHSTDDQISLGDHTERLAWYGSLGGYRTDLGLETSSPEVVHDQAVGLNAFGSIIFNQTPADQLRLTSSMRGDHYQVPIDPASQEILDDVEDERDSFVNFSWLHTARNGIVTTLSPFYHFNRAHYVGGTNDPVRSEYDRGSNFIGGVTSVALVKRRHNFRAGFQVFGERDNQLYSVFDSSPGALEAVSPQRTTPWATIGALFLEDQFRATSWLTLNAGVRLTHYQGPVSENSADPRIGAAIQIPRLKWVLRGFYGRYYQPPPLVTVTDVVLNGDQSFLPLRGERDEQREFGLTVPFYGWTFDLANFRTAARNFFDHDVLGNSNVFFPLTIAHARIRGWETTLKSPAIAGRVNVHLAYSHQYAEGAGEVTGGLTEFVPPEQGYFFLDHDERDTISTGFDVSLPQRCWAGFNLNHGSGFLDGEGPEHLPSHTTFEVSLGTSLGENWSLRVSGLNLSNQRYLLDNANTFGGTHFVNPREISVQLKYRFRF